MSTFHTNSSSNSDLIWDKFIASLHRVWEYAPDFSPTGPISLAGRNVFLVDCDFADREQLSDQLNRMGSSVTMIDSIDQANLMIAEHIVDLVILGSATINEDILEFCRFVCDTPSMMNVPIIVLTYDERPEMVRLARRAGAKFYLRKPYDPYVLLTLLSVALQSND